MPISQRDEHDAAGGNHVTVTRFVLPVDAENPADRIIAMHDAVEVIRAERALDHTEAIAGFLNLMPNGVIGAMLKGVDFLASNVPGVPDSDVAGGHPGGAILPVRSHRRIGDERHADVVQRHCAAWA